MPTPSQKEQEEAFLAAQGARQIPVVYGKVDDTELEGTLYLPAVESDTLLPVVIFFHGGFMNSTEIGHRKFARQAAYMTRMGFAGLCVKFRYAVNAAFPGPVENGRCAVRWVRAHAEAYGLDPDRIGIAGSSAGGCQATFLLATQGQSQWEGQGGWQDEDSGVKAGVVFCALTTFCPPLGPVDPTPEERARYLGGTYAEIPEVYEHASPLTHVTELIPPVLLLHGEADAEVPVDHARLFHERVLAAGGISELKVYPEVGHGMFRPESLFRETLQAIIQFFQKHV